VIKRFALIIVSALVLGGCVTSPPQKTGNICHIFEEKDDWYDDAKDAYEEWGTPIPVSMAIMHQESHFVADALPPRTSILWIFPGPRPTTAYGYSQALDETWDWYQRSSGNSGADRDDFEDAIDFVGWYNSISHRKNSIKYSDAYHLYLAYHEGHGGFQRRSFKSKDWLKGVAKKVSARANRYRKQLKSCEADLQSSWWFL